MSDIINTQEIRSLLRDLPEKNPLNGFEEFFEDEEIFLAAEQAKNELIDLFPVFLSTPIPKVVLNTLTIAYLLESVSAEQLRNKITINDNNVGVIDFDNKSEEYLRLASYYRTRAEKMAKMKIKQSYLNDMWGGDVSMSYLIDRGY